MSAHLSEAVGDNIKSPTYLPQRRPSEKVAWRGLVPGAGPTAPTTATAVPHRQPTSPSHHPPSSGSSTAPPEHDIDDFRLPKYRNIHGRPHQHDILPHPYIHDQSPGRTEYARGTMSMSSRPNTGVAAPLLRKQFEDIQTSKILPGISCGLSGGDNLLDWEVMFMINDDCKYYGGMSTPPPRF